MDKQLLSGLLKKYKDNACSNEELAELELWYQSLNTGTSHIETSEAEAFAQEMLIQFRQKLAIENPTISIYKKYVGQIAAAAAIILLLGTGAYFLVFNRTPKGYVVKTEKPVLQDIAAPKTSKASITLADGTNVLLDSINNGTLAMQGNVDVIKTADGKIVYSAEAPPIHQELQYNILSNPRGSKVQPLTLSDGTKVWLNSESSIKYPVAFIGNQRKVEITGEAYFEVSKDANKHFFVDAKGVITEVLGTHFNVNAYDDESSTKITLLEGAVKISKGGFLGLLKPGQQAIVTHTSIGEIKVWDGVNTDEVMAWKEGKFQFGEKADLANVMRQIARWYDVDVEYTGTVFGHIGGGISKDVNASQVLKMLEATGVASFRVDGKKVIISPH